VPSSVYDSCKSSTEVQTPVLDVTAAGAFKVLGKGHLPKVPIIVRAKYFSRYAEKKIKQCGGACVLTA
jgi:large subunit ribosomal protein L27Ae